MWRVFGKMGGLLTHCLLMLLVYLTATDAVQYPSRAGVSMAKPNDRKQQTFRLLSENNISVTVGTRNAVFNIGLDPFQNNPITWTPSSYQPLLTEMHTLGNLILPIFLYTERILEVNEMLPSNPASALRIRHPPERVENCYRKVLEKLMHAMRPWTLSSYQPLQIDLHALPDLIDPVIQQRTVPVGPLFVYLANGLHSQEDMRMSALIREQEICGTIAAVICDLCISIHCVTGI